MADSERRPFKKNSGEKHWKNNKFKRNQPGQNQKSKIKGFHAKQQRMVIKHYKQTLKEERKHLQSQNDETAPESNEQGIERINKKLKMTSFQRAQEILKRKQEEIQERKEEKARIEKEREEKREKYRENKMRKMNILRQKTKKGQPIMKGRIELLLQRIEKMVKN